MSIANLPKSRDAKLKGLKAKAHDSQLPNTVLFTVTVI
jgi:hypothetical protein